MKKQTQRKGRFQIAIIAVAALACLLLMVLVPEAAANLLSVLSVIALGAVTTVGDVTETTVPDTNKVRDVSDVITRKKPHRNPLWVAMRKLRKGKRATAEKIEWFSRGIIPRNTTVSGAVAAGAAGAAVTWTLANAGIYRVDDVITLPLNSSAQDANVQVTAVNPAANTITVVRVDGGSASAWGTVPAVADGETIVRIGNAKEEFYLKSNSRSTVGFDDYNYVQREDVLIAISNTKKATKTYSESWAEQKDEQIYDFLSSAEYRLFFGRRAIKTLGNERKTFMGGVLDYSLPNAFTYSAATLDTAKAIDIVRAWFVGNTGSEVRYLHADSVLIRDFMLIFEDSVRMTQMDSKILMRKIPELDLGFGRVRLIHEQIFDEMGKTRFGVGLDYEQLTLRDLNPMKAVLLDLEKTEGRDGTALQLKEECSLEVRYEETHCTVDGTA